MPSDNANKTNIRIVKSDEGSSESVSATNERSAATETAVCQYCFGTGMEVVAGKGARPCRCRAQDFRGKLLEAARIPRRYQHCSIHTFYNVDHEMSKFVALGEAKKLIEEYPLQAERRGLLLVGPVGPGKTHLAVPILRELIGR